jgi:RHH-type transcriptional regulator, proline utilization regulon repressor / proline dehydrogenase / delta 1-pyrroline-5-carboxylate dehydrogenase
MDTDNQLEGAITRIGRELYSTTAKAPPLFDSRTWIGRLMDWSMKNEEFKTSLFRFIDVLPSLRNDETVVSLMREYLGSEDETPKILRIGIGLIPGKDLGSRLAGPVIRKAVTSIARQFIVAGEPETIVKTLHNLQQDGTRFTIDLLGEVVVSDREASRYLEAYLSLLDLLQEQFPHEAAVSLKVSSFDSQLDPVDWSGSINRATEGLRPILSKAKQTGISLTFDMEHFSYKDLIIELVKNVLLDPEFQDGPNVSLALQAYLIDTVRDLRGLIAWLREQKKRIGIRLVKGAYWDYEYVKNTQQGWPVPVFLNKAETDRNFERCTRLLFESIDAVFPEIATHNLRSIAHAAATAESLGIGKDGFEFQMLYGMAEELRKAVRAKGYPVRVYTPVGELVPGMAYLVRRLLENTSNTSFLRRAFSERLAFEELIAPPVAPSAAAIQAAPGPGFRNQPLLDFSASVNREQFSAALKAVKAEAGRTYPLIIGGNHFLTGKESVSHNPADPAEIVGRIASATKRECDRAIQEAEQARDLWRRTPPDDRAEFLFKAAEEMRKQRFSLAALEVIEVGKTWKDADGDVAEAIDYCEYYAREMIRIGGPKKTGRYPGEVNECSYLPKGIAVVIAPWNFPLAIATGMTVAAIVAGNCTIFKPSGLSPAIGFRLCEIFRTIGLPPGVLQFLPGPGSEIGEHLVSHPAVDVIAFTGSKDVGLRIVRLAAETSTRSVKKVIAEMGGKNAVIVDETADLDEAVKGIVESAFGYQGQKCSACSRVIVLADVEQEFRERLTEAIKSIRIGPPEDPSNSMGPMIDEKALEKVRTYIEIGKQEATPVLLWDAPARSGQGGWFAGPSVFADASPDSRIAQEEIFGPVLTLMRAKTIDEAIDLANRSQYALTGGLFSRSPENIRKVREGFLSGNLYINRKITGALVGRQPFGGFGMSGVGSKAGGPDYLLQFMNPVCITENTIRRGFAPMDTTATEKRL